MAGRYDRALTLFSPDGHLVENCVMAFTGRVHGAVYSPLKGLVVFQVEYAMEAVKRGSSVVCIQGKDVIVLGIERRATAKLQDPRTIRKIVKLDDHVTLAFAGLTADARVLINKARVECQSYRLTCEDAPSLEYVARFIANILAGYSQGRPQVFQTDPAGTYSAWKANTIGGKNSKNVHEFLQKNWVADMEDAVATKLCIKALLEVVDSGAKNMEVCLIRRDAEVQFMSLEEMQAVVDEIEAEAQESKSGSSEQKE